MATELQKDLAQAIITNKKLPVRDRKNKTQLLESVGYSQLNSFKNQKRTLTQKGVKEALGEYGLTEGLVITSLVDDIAKKPKNRLGELRLGADILGLMQKTEGNKTLIVMVSSETAKRYAITPDTKTSST